ncbi:putative aminoacyltransferase, E1 ubiquitin-activating enzyme [Rosa chinensis]|uniref:RING-type E3 ubiquitin transferase n=2 Tax=Rosa chinensis TaxID=74649 RepID=A0A2P6QH56_ROSCH|nr:putative aminoacyltransferase, E1 ubiquitin-activating enzyme [Rosa chinensis]
MSMATENWQVVGDITCNPKYLGLVQPEKELPNTKFLMDFNVKMRRAQSTVLEDDEEIVEEKNLRSVELEYNPHSMWVAINKELQDLQVPIQVRAAIEDPILKGTRVARADSSYDARKYLHMEVAIDFRVGVFDGISEYEPAFVPASEASIKKLGKTRAEVSSTMCTVCMEEMMVGSEATRMPCSHLYHESCIVEWLQKSGVCPSCKFRMPTDDDE